ncbi:hypothetical protein ACK3F5_09050 [Photorhabdus asymbiotica UENP]
MTGVSECSQHQQRGNLKDDGYSYKHSFFYYFLHYIEIDSL